MSKLYIMIQRIQSVFLFLACLVTGGLIIAPVQLATISNGRLNAKVEGESVLADGIFHSTDHVLLLAIIGVNMLIILVAVFMYKNRSLQLTLARIGIAISFIFVVLSGFLFYQAFELLTKGTELTIEYGVLLPFITIILLILAIRFIGKDEKLVRSMDRLR